MKQLRNLYFLYHCVYNARTEKYDRLMTDKREMHDPTSAYIGVSQEVKNASNSFAFDVYMWCKRKIEEETKRPFDTKLWRESIREYENMSAQGWIDLYNHLVDTGEMAEIETP